VDASEPLLQSVRVPRQVVIHHQVGALQIDAFARRGGGEQHLDFGIVQESFLGLATFLAAHAAVDHNHGFWPAEQRADLPFEIIERVAMLGEKDQFLAR